ncbi:MAG: hypothetical protein WC659_05410 [Patescibacteria group bacterium]
MRVNPDANNPHHVSPFPPEADQPLAEAGGDEEGVVPHVELT